MICGASSARRIICVPSDFSSTGDTAKMSTVMNPDFRNAFVTFNCVRVAG